MLTALPKTPLHARLARDGRLDPGDDWPTGTNVVPLRMTRESLRDGYVALMRRLYDRTAYFDRFEDLYVRHGLAVGGRRASWLQRHPWRRRAAHLRTLARAAYVFARLMTGVESAALRREYRSRALGLLRRRPEPDLLLAYALKCAVHAHVDALTRGMINGSRVVNTM
jgi:hypothetical protein